MRVLNGIKEWFFYAVSHIAYFFVDLINFTKIVVMFLLYLLWYVIDWALDCWKNGTSLVLPTYWYYIIVVIGVILATMLGGYVYINKMDKAVSAVIKLWKDTNKSQDEIKRKTDKLVSDTEDTMTQTFISNSRAEVQKQSVTNI